VEIVRSRDAVELTNGGVTSRQLLFPENSRSQRITITRVTLAPGATNPPHRHESSEQVWVVLRGAGQLLLEDGRREPLAEGDIARFEDNDLHGFENTGDSVFEYMSVTSPPVNFRGSYAKSWK
jgi:quercetin dioxygenase-like cupin family protein